MEPERLALSEKWIIMDELPLFFRFADQATGTSATPIIHVHGFGISGRYLVPTAELLRRYIRRTCLISRGMAAPISRSAPSQSRSLPRPWQRSSMQLASSAPFCSGTQWAAWLLSSSPTRIQTGSSEPFWSPGRRTAQPADIPGIAALGRDSLLETPRIIPIAVPDYIRFGPFSSMRLFHAMTQYPTIERVLALDLPIMVVAGARDPLVSKERLKSSWNRDREPPW